ncbi:MAG: class II fructose-bisphosphatase [Bdellovibrionaceae bacterium]|jgi:fructose-1,6-bisphosphatase II|nr:class II fructose-bisphosphatase [Pseudobdellovibrionaceae bacterium]
MNRNLALELVRITEAAALASSRWMGRGDEKKADQAAVDAMRKAFDRVLMKGEVVIGEGERDEAPMLYIGEKVGQVGPDAPELDIALDPLEGTTICAKGSYGAISVIAAGEKGHLLKAPDVYMDKIACGPAARGAIDLDATPTENIHRVAECLRKNVEDVTVVILDRPRHQALIEEVRKTGARIYLIGDGDVSAAIAAAWPDSGIDMLLGIGGAPEGVISAAALVCLGGDFQGRLKYQKPADEERAQKMGLKDLHKKWQRDELASGKVMFCATGVTNGPLLEGVKFLSHRLVRTQSLVMRSESGTIRKIEALHDLNKLPKI